MIKVALALDNGGKKRWNITLIEKVESLPVARHELDRKIYFIE
jgi:hypothetical protein